MYEVRLSQYDALMFKLWSEEVYIFSVWHVWNIITSTLGWQIHIPTDTCG